MNEKAKSNWQIQKDMPLMNKKYNNKPSMQCNASRPYLTKARKAKIKGITPSNGQKIMPAKIS